MCCGFGFIEMPAAAEAPGCSLCVLLVLVLRKLPLAQGWFGFRQWKFCPWRGGHCVTERQKEKADSNISILSVREFKYCCLGVVLARMCHGNNFIHALPGLCREHHSIPDDFYWVFPRFPQPTPEEFPGSMFTGPRFCSPLVSCWLWIPSLWYELTPHFPVSSGCSPRAGVPDHARGMLGVDAH